MIEQQILPRIQILGFSYKEALEAAELTHHLFSTGQPIGTGERHDRLDCHVQRVEGGQCQHQALFPHP